MSPQASGWRFRKPIKKKLISFLPAVAEWKSPSSTKEALRRKEPSCSFPGLPRTKQSWPSSQAASPNRICAYLFRICPDTATAPVHSHHSARRIAARRFSRPSLRAAWPTRIAPSSPVIRWARPSLCASPQEFPWPAPWSFHPRRCAPPTAFARKCFSIPTPAPCRNASWSSVAPLSQNPCAPTPPILLLRKKTMPRSTW